MISGDISRNGVNGRGAQHLGEFKRIYLRVRDYKIRLNNY